MADRHSEHADPVQPAAGGSVLAGSGADLDGDPAPSAMSEPAPATGTLDISKVGGRLRAERERLQISLRELAWRVGVSPSLVSQIELDRVNPSVSTLYALVTELGMTMSEVFGDSRPGERAAPQLPGADGLAERPETRRVINLASGVRWERLTPPHVERKRAISSGAW